MDLDYYLQGEDDDDEIELLGAIMGDDPILGARMLRAARASRGNMRSALSKALVPRTPGVPTPGGRQQPLGFTPVQFTNTSALQLNLTCEPDRPFKGNRLIIALERSASGSGGLFTVVRFDIGGKNQLASAQPVIVDAFANTATISLIAIDPLTPGVPGVLTIACTAQPGVSETVDVGAMLYGLSIS